MTKTYSLVKFDSNLDNLFDWNFFLLDSDELSHILYLLGCSKSAKIFILSKGCTGDNKWIWSRSLSTLPFAFCLSLIFYFSPFLTLLSQTHCRGHSRNFLEEYFSVILIYYINYIFICNEQQVRTICALIRSIYNYIDEKLSCQFTLKWNGTDDFLW